MSNAGRPDVQEAVNRHLWLPIATLCLMPRQADDKQLPPWLQVNDETLQRMYGRGVTDAGRPGKGDALTERLRRSLGQIDARPLPEEAESYVWLVDPFAQAYQFGWRARRDDLSSEQIRAIHDQLVAWAAQGRKRVTFEGVLQVLRPAPAGRLTHAPTPDIFRDLTVELKVAGRRYHPAREPGDLAPLAGRGTYLSTGDRTIPSPLPAVAIGPGEITSGEARVTNYFTVYRTLKYDFYQGHFTVVFDLFESDGTPRVRQNDVGLSAIVITAGGNEHQAEYKWTDLMDIRAAK